VGLPSLDCHTIRTAGVALRIDAEERAKLRQQLEASFAEEEAGELIDVGDAIADLKAHRENP
jgi:hypothetical protein